MTVLYIDDDSDDQALFKEALLKVSPHSKLYLASDGLEGVDVLNSIASPPDYIFLDVNMPRMDGKEFLTKIRKDPNFSRIPIIVYTTSNNPEEKEDILSLGAIQFFTKGHSFSEVCQLLKSFI